MSTNSQVVSAADVDTELLAERLSVLATDISANDVYVDAVSATESYEADDAARVTVKLELTPTEHSSIADGFDIPLDE